MEFNREMWAAVHLARSAGRRVAFVPGVFDLLHSGHIQLLTTARDTGALVVAGVFDDASSRVIKGPGRPVLPESARQQILKSLQAVDVAVVVDGLEQTSFLEKLRPDFVVRGKGDDSVVSSDTNSRILEVEPVGSDAVSSILDDIIEGVDLAPGRPHPKRRSLDGDEAQSLITFAMPAMQYLGVEYASSPVFTICGPPGDDLIFSEIRRSKAFYEMVPLMYLARLVPKKGVVFDIGANIGNHSIFFAAFMAAQVIALEPAPELFALLRRNIELNALTNIQPFQLAAGDRSGWGRVHRPPSSIHNTGAWQVRPVKEAGMSGDVRITTLDSLAESIAEMIGDLPVTLLKIDVEGSEFAVLRGAEQTIRNHRPLIYVELTIDVTFNAVTWFLNKLGYRALMRFETAIPSYIFEPAP